ncbi:hypothetical protein EXIGLDRAFT_768602 [Exidia glandulosa HHB12029]|uniref:TFG box profile domain-containing protein n=1 Tax=Exidia glandulosa HHB12029 TaxID=1314781 RepID=A0A165I4B3_EXIGL|nr:hypothetical protein EXIGLDRAFT_768602 [Exidia glandulosa HHB12029]
MAAQTFIGRVISLTSSSDIRYTGILEGIDQQSSTITLKNVFSMGTEFRRPPGSPDYIPPSHQPYEQIVFKAANVKDISVDDTTRALPNDPAVLSGQPGQVNQIYPPYTPGNAGFPAHAQPVFNNQPPTQVHLQVTQNQQPTRGGGRSNQRQQGQPTPPPDGSNNHNRRGNRGGQNGVRAAEASLETVGRALNDLQVTNEHPRQQGGGRRNGHDKAVPVPVPDSDFDFQQSNARFNKAALSPARVDDDQKTNPSDSDSEDKAEREKYYNPTKSFFDTLSTSAPLPQGGRGGGGGGGGGARRGRGGGRGRNRREEEREKNISTFGEPGGVGILGAGAYVGGWGSGGHGGRRRGGGGPHNGVVSGGTVIGGGGARR